MFQIKPVKGSYVFQEPFNPHSLAYHSVSPLWTMFEPFELTVNHRQGEGSKWVETLNRIRNQTFTEDDIKVLRSRIIPKASLDKDVFHVMYTNKLVAEYNKKVLEQLDGEEYVFMAIKSSKNCAIHKDKGTIDSTSFVNKLVLKIGSRVKLVYNIDTIDGLVNGAMGNVIALERNPKGEIYAIVVQFDQKSVGQEHRQNHKSVSDKYKKQNGTPIFKKSIEYFKHSGGGRAKLIQFPIDLADAATSHTTQVNF